MRIVHYINQFFAGIGGEAAADTPPSMRPGAVGPGHALQRALGAEAEIVGTVICGDGVFADRMDETASAVLGLIEALAPGCRRGGAGVRRRAIWPGMRPGRARCRATSRTTGGHGHVPGQRGGRRATVATS